MKIIFLDVDGVLNTREDRIQSGILAVCKRKVNRLLSIVRATGALIVVSSTWRKIDMTRQALDAALAEANLLQDVIGETPVLNRARYREIEAWLKEHPEVERFAILDDAESAWHKDERFFQTSDNIGLTVDIANQVIQHLNREQ